MEKNLQFSWRLGLHTETEREIWLNLGEKDLSRVAPDHERALYAYLLSQGAEELLIWRGDEACLRCLLMPLDREAGVFSIGFLASSVPQIYSDCESVFEEALQSYVQRVGAREIIGPVNGTTWFPYRLRTDSHPLHFAWEPARQPELERFLRATGFETIAHYHSVCTEGLRKYIQDTERDYRSVLERGFKIEELDVGKLTIKDIQELYQLASDGFADNYLFHPISFEAFYKIYLYGKSGQTTYLSVVRDSKQQAVAFAMAFVQDKELVYKTATTHRSHRRQGMSNALFHAIGSKYAADLSDRYISALVFKGLTSESYAAHGNEVWRHTYVLLRRLVGG